jgi:formylmethanofuran dehydrogenase subunit E
MSRDGRFVAEFDRIMAETTPEDREGFPVVADRVLLFKEIGRLREENERFRKTLEWYANEANYNMETEDVFSTADIDSGHRARQVLKEKETPEAKCDCDDEWIFDEEEPIRGRIFEEEEQ